MGVALLLLLVRNMPTEKRRRRRKKNHFVLLIQDADAFFEQPAPAPTSPSLKRIDSSDVCA
jgi:hypothetical protein